MRQIVKVISIVTIAVTVLVGLTTAASAAPVLIVNAGFEAPSLVDSQAIFTAAGWVNVGDSGTFDPHAAALRLARLKGTTWPLRAPAAPPSRRY